MSESQASSFENVRRVHAEGASGKRPAIKRAGQYVVGKPYSMKGKRYYPKEEPSYDRRGVASWYGSAFQGRRTANGETYDADYLSAAHPTLPLPSYVRVTNLESGASLIVRVNDRGPYHDGRLIDLSGKAAEMLDLKRRGTATVRVQYVGRPGMGGDDRAFLMASHVRKGRNLADVNSGSGQLAYDNWRRKERPIGSQRWKMAEYEKRGVHHARRDLSYDIGKFVRSPVPQAAMTGLDVALAYPSMIPKNLPAHGSGFPRGLVDRTAMFAASLVSARGGVFADLGPCPDEGRCDRKRSRQAVLDPERRAAGIGGCCRRQAGRKRGA
ncbi:septal ring lytic transglycosylase RlpA family protein [Ensifer sp.]|uniref:septal ring lytic transglycosylase RlpA family protein n=1 Tax=Ensifer sp. TaxID=1872086 RepID=UPI002E1396B5|nr:septal ring lytic transglycosylase RlpA family protein [Ensifer sp.]